MPGNNRSACGPSPTAPDVCLASRAGLCPRRKPVTIPKCRTCGAKLELTLGEVAGAVGDAEQSLTYADRSGDAFMRMAFRTPHADALHQAGLSRRSEAKADRQFDAETRFREAEQMQQERQSDYPLLYSVQGFRYCDLLLTEAERAAWQLALRSAAFTPLQRPNEKAASGELERGSGINAALQSCRAVSQRAAQTLKWAAQRLGLLDNALNHLTLGRAALYAAILEWSAALRAAATPDNPKATNSAEPFFFADTAAGHRPALPAIQTARRELDAAVSGLRRAGDTTRLPLGLLTRAWLRFLTGARTGPESAQADLDEAWEIAERGPMKLHMADILLHRGRLFCREQPYPWPSPQADLAAARKLIEQCGYWRRKEELEDAEKVIGVGSASAI